MKVYIFKNLCIIFSNCFSILKVDTFKIKTKKLGSLRSIEIGHDGKGFGKYTTCAL